ncbi:hypothetical protein KAR91_41855 [Candidatus Pacearchaeota archaeon]|nr:hypothetical protein [Candidatus Pacearchaeota archaeon]
MISKEDDKEIEEMELKPDSKKVSVEGRVMPSHLQREGYKLNYIGLGDDVYRHYPHSFITGEIIDGEWRFIKDNRRTDTVKSLPKCLHIWEYAPDIMLDGNGNRSIFDDVDE